MGLLTVGRDRKTFRNEGQALLTSPPPKNMNFHTGRPLILQIHLYKDAVLGSSLPLTQDSARLEASLTVNLLDTILHWALCSTVYSAQNIFCCIDYVL